MSIRTVTGHLLHPVTGLDWADAPLLFRLRARFATTDYTLPPERTEVVTSASGTFSVGLMVPDTGASAVYGLLLPGNLDHEYTFYLNSGTAVTLQELILYGGDGSSDIDIPYDHITLKATRDTLAHVKVGAGLGATADGTLFVTGTFADDAVTEAEFNAHVATLATRTAPGHAQIGAGLGVTAGVVFLTGTYVNYDEYLTHTLTFAQTEQLGHIKLGVGLGYDSFTQTTFVTGTYPSLTQFNAHTALAATHSVLGHMQVGVGLGHNGSGLVFVTGTFMSLSNSNPSYPGTASAGASSLASRSDHVHPLAVEFANYLPIGGGVLTGTVFRAPQFAFTNDSDTGFGNSIDGVIGVTANNAEIFRIDSTGLLMRSDASIRFASSTSYGTADVQLTRDAVGVLALSRLTSAAAEFRIYQATGSNYERLTIKGSSSLWQFVSEFGGTVTASKPFIFTFTDTGTADVINVIHLSRESSGTPAANFGLRILGKLKSSTTVERNAGGVEFGWEVATDASRSGRTRIQAYDASAARTGFTVGTASNAPTISFYGGTLTAKQTITGSRGGNAALASLLTALAAFGLLTDSSTA